jgi:hypothetical protein
MIEINCDGGRIGRFWWDNSGCGSRYFPSFRPQRFIPVFDTQEQAVEWGSDGDTIVPITTAPNETP